ncbi:MAG: helix-turn-helix domain-containing protein [Lysobacterales bacterium]
MTSTRAEAAPCNPRPLIDALKRALRREGITYARLAPRLGLTEASIKRLFSQGRFSLQQVLQICDVLGVELSELARGSHTRAEEARELSLAQERALAEEPRLLLLFHLLCSGWTAAALGREFGIDGSERTLLLARLDRLGLIELQPRDRVRLRVPRDFRWRSHGPVRRRYGAQVLQEFMLDRFGGERSLLRFEARELSEASIQVLRRKLERLALEVAELAELDAGLPESRKRSMGVAVAMRPWVFSLAAALKASVAKPAR